jgi:hypothetical protein
MIENKVVISVSGGNVNGVFINDPKTMVYLVDFDNLNADASEDCSQSYPAGRIDEFRSRVAEEIKLFPGLEKLLTQLRKK